MVRSCLVSLLIARASQAESGAGMHPAGNCTAANNFANHGIQIAYLTAQGPSNTTLTDIGVHGMPAQGVLGSHINQAPGDFFTGSYIFIRGNGLPPRRVLPLDGVSVHRRRKLFYLKLI